MGEDGLRRAAAMFARFPKLACAETLGWELLDADPEAGEVTIGFEGRPEFCNPAGHVQGGFLAAMLDDTLGPAVLVKSDGAWFAPPARPGRLSGVGKVVQLGRTVAFLEARLTDAAGTLVATATASARLVATGKL